MKIVNIDKENLHIFISLYQLEEFQWNFQERCDLGYTKGGIQPLSEKHIFKKAIGEGGASNWPPAFLGLTKVFNAIVKTHSNVSRKTSRMGLPSE